MSRCGAAWSFCLLQCLRDARCSGRHFAAKCLPLQPSSCYPGGARNSLRESVCCLLMLNSVTSTPQWIRQPKPCDMMCEYRRVQPCHPSGIPDGPETEFQPACGLTRFVIIFFVKGAVMAWMCGIVCVCLCVREIESMSVRIHVCV